MVLNHMEDPWSPVPAGTRGTVAAVDAIGQIHMKWDNGRSLALVPGADSFRKLTAEEIAKEELEKQQATDLITAEDLTEQAVLQPMPRHAAPKEKRQRICWECWVPIFRMRASIMKKTSTRWVRCPCRRRSDENNIYQFSL